MIIAEKLQIRVFRGCLESEYELKFFSFVGFNNRFRYNSDHSEQERLSRMPYIEIKEDSASSVPFLRIYNYEIETTKIKNAKIAMYHIKIKYFGFDFS